MRKIFVWLAFLPFVNGLAQDYNVNLIPADLRAHAHAVKRMEELHVVIKSVNKVVVQRKYAITVLDDQGDVYAQYANSYGSLNDLGSIDGNLYDGEGKKLKNVKRRDINDLQASDGFSLALDVRFKVHNFHHHQYPYTVEYEDESTHKQSFALPSWRAVEGEHFSVQQSRFIVEVPADYALRYKQVNFFTQPLISGDPATTYIWEMKDQRAFVGETFVSAQTDRLPYVMLGPTAFAVPNYSGDMRTWADLGKFVAELNKNRDQLPDKVKQDVHQLIDGVQDKAEKVRKLYKYMQENTRYVSVQLGIGGWQPFDAKYVAANKYGDCKALSNYMVSLLKEAGIKADYVLITAGKGRNGLAEDFPSANFNHAVCCVPNGKDSIWLECTNQTVPAGFMGSFTGDRTALLIDEDGGHVVRTPSYKAKDNQQLRCVKAVIDEQGNMVADVNTRFTGIQQEQRHAQLHGLSDEEMHKYLNRAFSIPTYEVDKSDFSEIPGNMPCMDERLHLKAPNFATVSGKRIFIVPNFLNTSNVQLAEEPNRKSPIQFTEAFTNADTIRITVPDGYMVEALPKNTSLENQFGKFDLQYVVNNNSVAVVRVQVRERKTLPSWQYPSLVKYYDEIYKADRGKIVFVKKEG